MLLAESDISSVPADFVKNWWIMLGFALMLWMQWRNGNGQKREISGSIETRSEREHADKAETEKRLEEIEDDIELLTTTNAHEHQEAAKAGAARVEKIKEHIDQKLSAHDEKLEAVRKSIEHFMQLTAAHAAVIPQLDERITQLAQEQNTNVQRLHARIDDAVRLSLPPRKP